MAAVVSTPILTWVAAILPGGVGQSSSLTTTINLTNAWEIQAPVQVQWITSAISADPIINFYAISGAGGTPDTVPFASFSIARATVAQSSIRLPVGQYLVQLQNSGPYTATFIIQTQQVLTAINNV